MKQRHRRLLVALLSGAALTVAVGLANADSVIQRPPSVREFFGDAVASVSLAVLMNSTKRCMTSLLSCAVIGVLQFQRVQRLLWPDL